jgi:hypothetical protein
MGVHLFGLVFLEIRAKDTDAPDMIPLLKFVLHAPQLIQYVGCMPHVPEGIEVLHI